ncbi:MAG: L(+)-tartrate dehydratase subunit alpha [Oscillospiraceae bacterium]|nr:L(+)-tartrate dehydratase subunit alpha [Oscillospiraceae bacterium]MBR2806078.1 L(+)-tartrate dehydratase subunit alpha [Oscillospiraceae bacterium]
MNKQEARAVMTDVMEKFLGLACKRLPDDVYAKLKECREKETSEMQKVIYDTYFDNLEKAIELNRPCCQDTGLLHFYINCGSEFPYMGIVEEALREATSKATFSSPLRQNTVNWFEERNTGDNTGERMPWLHWEIIPDNSDLEICTYFAGGGCCLPGCAKVFKPSDGYAAIVKYVFDAVSDLGINACPPLIVGVGLGHNMENAAVLSKMAYLRPLGTHHHHPKGEKLEKDLLEGLNKLGIGAQGLPGNQVAMEVHVESSARHTATIAVGVNVACYAHRRGFITFHDDMSYDFSKSYKGVEL